NSTAISTYGHTGDGASRDSAGITGDGGAGYFAGAAAAVLRRRNGAGTGVGPDREVRRCTLPRRADGTAVCAYGHARDGASRDSAGIARDGGAGHCARTAGAVLGRRDGAAASVRADSQIRRCSLSGSADRAAIRPYRHTGDRASRYRTSVARDRGAGHRARATGAVLGRRDGAGTGIGTYGQMRRCSLTRSADGAAVGSDRHTRDRASGDGSSITGDGGAGYFAGAASAILRRRNGAAAGIGTDGQAGY